MEDYRVKQSRVGLPYGLVASFMKERSQKQQNLIVGEGSWEFIIRMGTRLLGKIDDIPVDLHCVQWPVADISKWPSQIINRHIVEASNMMWKIDINSNETNIQYSDTGDPSDLDEDTEGGWSDSCPVDLEHFRC